jgi:hypothetical protein
MRELREETGRIVDAQAVRACFKKNKSCLFLAVDNFKHWCKIDQYEIDNYDWVNIDDLKKLATSKFTKSFIPCVERYLNTGTY